MRVPTTYEILEIDESQGTVVLKWNNGITLNHRIPIEAELENWTDAQIDAHLLSEAPSIPDVPQFLRDKLVARVETVHASTRVGGPNGPPN